MGDRVAVMRDGQICSRSTRPQRLYDHPVNLFVAGFIGSPAMNLVHSQLDGAGRRIHAAFGPRAWAPATACSRRGLPCAGTSGKPVIAGLRPEDIEDAAFAPSANGSSLDVERRPGRVDGRRGDRALPDQARADHRRAARAVHGGAAGRRHSAALTLLAADAARRGDGHGAAEPAQPRQHRRAASSRPRRRARSISSTRRPKRRSGSQSTTRRSRCTVSTPREAASRAGTDAMPFANARPSGPTSSTASPGSNRPRSATTPTASRLAPSSATRAARALVDVDAAAHRLAEAEPELERRLAALGGRRSACRAPRRRGSARGRRSPRRRRSRWGCRRRRPARPRGSCSACRRGRAALLAAERRVAAPRALGDQLGARRPGARV